MAEGSAGNRHELEPTGYGHNPLWQPALPHTNRLWTDEVCNLVPVSKTGLLQCHPWIGVHILRKGTAWRDPHGQRHSLLQHGVRRFVDEWGIRLRHRSAYVPSHNSIAERCYWSVKRIAARKACTIAEALYRYNATPKDAVTAASAPANAIHRYRVRIKGIDACLPDWQGTRGPYELGDTVWVKPPNSRCTTSFQRGRIIGIVSEQAVLVDGTPRHVRDICWRVAAVVNYPTINWGSDLHPASLMVRLQTPTLKPMPLLRAQMKKSRQSPFVGVPATNDHVCNATCLILRPGGSVDMKVRLTVALDKTGFVCAWRAGQ